MKNDAEQLIFQTEKAIKDLGDKVDQKEKEEAEDLVKDLKEALEKNDMDKVKDKKEKLQEKAMALATKVYEQAAKENQSNNNSEPKNDNNKDDVQDANYEEK